MIFPSGNHVVGRSGTSFSGAKAECAWGHDVLQISAKAALKHQDRDTSAIAPSCSLSLSLFHFPQSTRSWISPRLFSQCKLSLSGAGSEGWDQMREGARMVEEERGMRAGRKERRSDSRLLSGVPLTLSPMGCCSLPTSGGVSSGLRCPFRAVPAPVCLGVWCRHSPYSFSLSLSPAHVEARPARHCVNVIRSLKPVSLSSCSPCVTLFPPSLLFFSLVPCVHLLRW